MRPVMVKHRRPMPVGAEARHMSGWFVTYLDFGTNREMKSNGLATREQAIALALDREREGSLVRSIVGPSGEERWLPARQTG
jgi:hypothetical protein